MLAGKICFITGSSRGIGWATARVFAGHGATVLLNGRDAAVLELRAEELRAMVPGAEVVCLAADASNGGQIKAAYAEIFRRFKRLDVLVNNAGVLQEALLGMISEAMIRSSFDANAIGALIHLQEASRLMSRRGSGSIVNLTSIIGRVGKEGQSVYAATKAAIIGLTLAAAKELAPKGIRVNAVAPGFIDTDMTRQLPPATHQALVSAIRMGRVGTAEEVAQVIAFLAGDLASYVTGQIVGVDGGWQI